MWCGWWSTVSAGVTLWSCQNLGIDGRTRWFCCATARAFARAFHETCCVTDGTTANVQFAVRRRRRGRFGRCAGGTNWNGSKTCLLHQGRHHGRMERGQGVLKYTSCAELRRMAQWKRACAASMDVRTCASCRNFVHLAILLSRKTNPKEFPYKRDPKCLSIRDKVSGLKSTHDRDFSARARGPIRGLRPKLSILLRFTTSDGWGMVSRKLTSLEHGRGRRFGTELSSARSSGTKLVEGLVGARFIEALDVCQREKGCW